MNVAEFLDSTNHPLKKELIALRQLIKAANPALTEHVKWNAPSFCHNGEDRITFNLSRQDRILVIFHRGAKTKTLGLKKPLLQDDLKLLEWPACDRAVMKFNTMPEVIKRKDAVQKIVNDWIDVTSNHSL
jgi:hypothetical protein